MKTISNIYNVKKLKNRINLYGYDYSYKDYIIESLLLIGGMIAITSVYGLNIKFKVITILAIWWMIPLVINGWFKSKYNLKRFSELSDYLSNVLPIFNNKPKIIYTLNELKELTSGEINIKIKQAIDYIENTVDDPKLFENGLKIISDEFPSSRLISVNKFMIDVERSDSTSYQTIADNLYIDIENWIKRICLYQKDLLDKRNKLIILSLSSLVINSLFVAIYRGEEFFKGFADNYLYQFSTTIFIILLSLIIVIALSFMSGNWFIEDIKKDDEKDLTKTYIRYHKNSTGKVLKTIIGILFIILGLFLVYLNYLKTGIISIFLGIIIINLDRFNKYKAKKKLKEYFEISFPLWLREISLSIGNLTVLNSISDSIKNYEYPLRKEIRKFVKEANDNPLSIKPYNDFLDEYRLDGVRSSMRILFSLNSLSKENIKERLSFLSERNQELLAKSESLANRNKMASIELFGFIPIVLFTVQILISMVIMFGYVINNLGGNINV